MKIGFMKLGKSIRFVDSSNPIGGDNEPRAVLSALASCYPSYTFYLVGKSDFGRLNEAERKRMFPHGNVVDCWAGTKYEDVKTDEHRTHLIRWFKDREIRLDCTVMMIGQLSNALVHGKTMLLDEDRLITPLEMTLHYGTPQAYWLNDNDIPYVNIINDPRYTLKKPRDLMRNPFRSLSQYNGSYERRLFTSYDDQRNLKTFEIKYTYEGMETAFCVGRKRPDLLSIADDRDVDFMMVLNEGDPSRYPELKRWILDHRKDVEVWGQWNEKTVKDDERFKGSAQLNVLQERFRRVKTTFIIPIKKGWVTSKFIEMTHAGVVPFFHPTYDEQKHIPVPDYLRPRTPQELNERIREMCEHERRRKAVLGELQKNLLEQYYDGTFMADRVLRAVHEAAGVPHVEPTSKVTENLFEPKDETVVKEEPKFTLAGFFS